MLTVEKTNLFISDICELANEERTPSINRQIFGLISILDATGVGTWPFNTSDQNFMEYMSALSIAVSHLFRMEICERDAFVRRGMENVGLKSESLEKEQVPSDAPNVQEPEAVLSEEIEPDISVPTIITESIDSPSETGPVKMTELTVTRATSKKERKRIERKNLSFKTAVSTNQGIDLRKAAWPLNFIDKGKSHGSINNYLDGIDQCDVLAGKLPTKGSHVSRTKDGGYIDMIQVPKVLRDIEKCLARISENRMPDAIHTNRLDSLLGYMPALVSALTMREVKHYCGKLSPKFETAVAVLQSASLMR